ncbi:MAG: lipase maturation factor family protein, partial [Gammaproteobacteria bacterium]
SDVTALLRHNPFAEKPPRYVRALLYDYRYSTVEERKRTGEIWQRRALGMYYPAVNMP